MKQVCLLCERTSLDKNLYCQEPYCPAEMSPLLMGYGEWLGDIEIVRPVITLRASVLYEARHQQRLVYCKVAHPGAENTNRLKREAAFLQELRVKKERAPGLPTWLPPYADSPIDAKSEPYGRAIVGEHLLYYFLFEHVQGQPLRHVLTKHPQLWINHIGWLMVDLTSAVAYLQSKGLMHLGLCPEAVLVGFDEEPSVPRVLLFDLGLLTDQPSVGSNWYPFCVAPAYTAPELLPPRRQEPSYATDVYGLGLILYELLVGQPAFAFKLRSDEEVYAAVQASQRVRMSRTEDVKPIADIALRATAPQSGGRYASASEMAADLLKHFSDVPGMKRGRGPSLNTVLMVGIGMLALAFVVTLGVTLSELGVF